MVPDANKNQANTNLKIIYGMLVTFEHNMPLKCPYKYYCQP
jgi:hypothetical protein